MNIYQILPITQEEIENFRPTRLYVKELNGVRYFGKTIEQNIEKYKGSGTVWKKRIKKYGRKNVKTIWVSDWFYCPFHIQSFALMFSELNKIVESEEWDNYIPEDGLRGAGNNLGKAMTSAAKAKSSATKLAANLTAWNKGIPRTDREKELMAIRKRESNQKKKKAGLPTCWNKDKHHSQKTLVKITEKAKNRAKLLCIHCGKYFAPGNYAVWHGNRCKMAPKSITT